MKYMTSNDLGGQKSYKAVNISLLYLESKLLSLVKRDKNELQRSSEYYWYGRSDGHWDNLNARMCKL